VAGPPVTAADHADARALRPLLTAVHNATIDIDSRASALKLYRNARDAAQEAIPGPLGVAVATVLGQAAYERSMSPIGGSLGASKAMMALAMAVLGHEPSLTPPPK
jgi:hypothetical protein